MKWVMFLVFLMQKNWISSQTLANEDVKESRKLNFDECCPCQNSDNIVLGTNTVPSECPCRDTDSETASSIFTPTLRTAQSLDRPLKNKNEPKPLLNPEVGLASSVLETLRDVTEQEYEEALARDVARNALQVIDSSADDMPVSASNNIFNDILSPRNREAIDVIPEASHNEETRCVHPTLSRISEFGQFEIPPQRNLLNDFFHSKPAVLHKNIFDMDNSPSDIRENVLHSKNNLLDDIKFKTNILKSKLFPNNKGILQGRGMDESFENKYYNKPQSKIPVWKFVTPLDNLKSSKFFDSKNVQNNKKVVITPSFRSQQSDNHVTDKTLSSELINYPVSKEIPRFKNTREYNIDSKADTSMVNPVLSQSDNCNLKKEKNDGMIEVDENTSNFAIYIPPHNSTEILDAIPSPSETIANKNQLTDPNDSSPHEDSIENVSEINITPKPKQITHNKQDDINPNKIVEPTDLQDNTNNLSIEGNIEEADTYIPETACTIENSKNEINSFYSVSTPAPITIDTDVFNFPIIQNEEGNINYFTPEDYNLEEISQPIINIDKNKENKIKLFPNIKEDILKTFQNFKNMNEKLQEKIKVKMQDALQLANVKNNVVMKNANTQDPVFIPETLAIPHKSDAKTSNTPSNALSSHELQKMSDSILTLSSVNQNLDPHLTSSVKDVFDSNSEQSKIINCLAPADVNINKDVEEKPLNNNNIKEITSSGFKSQQHFRNLNTGISRDTEYKPISEIPLLKSSLNSKEQSLVRLDDTEMAALASEPKPQRNNKIGLDNTRYLNQDQVVQPNNELDAFGRSVLNVNNFFDNVKSTISNVFSKTNENNFRQTQDTEDKIDNNYKIKTQNRASDLRNPKLIKNLNFLKTPEAIQVDRIMSNFDPYKARVAVPETFYVDPILALDETGGKSTQTFNNLRNILPKTYSSKTAVHNTNDNVENENLRSLFRESAHNNPNSESTVLSPNILKNYRLSESQKLGNLKDLRDAALLNIHKSLGNPLRAVPAKENNRFLNKIGNENLLETMVNKRDELNEKLKAINFDFNDRLSSLSHRMADSILPSLNSQSLPPRRLITKSKSNVKNKEDLDYLRRINVPSDIRSASPKSKLNTQLLKKTNDNLSVSKPIKSLITDHLPDLKRPTLHEKFMTQTRTPAKSAFKSSPVNKFIKTETNTLKPKSKENKMKSATTSTRPKTQISRLKVPQSSNLDSIFIPKMSAPFEKKYYIPRLKSSEPYTLGSENILSRVSLDKETDTDKSVMDVSSHDIDTKLFSDFKDVLASNQEVSKNLALSKLREAFKAKLINRDSNLKASSNRGPDIISSASETVNRTVNREVEGSLKQNVQYKCNLLCSKDK